jgi:hypothetical protein
MNATWRPREPGDATLSRLTTDESRKKSNPGQRLSPSLDRLACCSSCECRPTAPRSNPHHLEQRKVPHWLPFWNQSRYDSSLDSHFQSKLRLHHHSLEIPQTTRHIRQFQMDQDNRRRMIRSESHCHCKNSCFHTSGGRGTTIRVLASDCLCGIDSQGISNANLIHADLKIRDALLQQCSSL